jgi:DNA excision repair protein ERCC-4
MYNKQLKGRIPDLDLQVYKASNPGLGVRVYFMIYQMTAEEHKYLASLRKEKDSFERLIRERGVSTQPVV